MNDRDHTRDRIAALDDLPDFKVADDDPDVRGWDVLASDGQKVGEVHELLVDTSAMRVKYLDVAVDDGLSTGKDAHVLVPIGTARLDDDEDRVLMPTLASSRITALPAYRRGELSRDYENRVLASFNAPATPGTAENDFYAGELFDDRRFYDARGRRPIP